MISHTMAPAPIAPKTAPRLAPAPLKSITRVAPPTATTRVAPATEPATAAPAQPASTDPRVELVQLDDATWRVCDATAVPGQRGYIVGYLQASDTEFEMLWMHPRPGVVHRHADFDQALRAISTRLGMFAR